MITILLIVALALFFLEIFIPGGILAFAGVLFVCAASVRAFIEYGATVGFSVFIGGILVALFLLYLELKFLTQTGIGKRLFGHQQVTTSAAGLGDTSHLIGQEGVAATRMTPGGKVRIGDATYAALSIDGYLAKGTTVIVKEADSFTIRVSTR